MDLITPVGGPNNLIKDESLCTSQYFSKSTPENPEEVSQIIKYCIENEEKITVHGGLTGLNGGGVPMGSHSMSTEKLTDIEYDPDTHTLWAESGAEFSDILTLITKESMGTRELPVYPTEKSATIGGGISFGSSGLRSYRYGKISEYVDEIEFCDANGDIQLIKRGDSCFEGFLASEGMLGIITKVKIRTIDSIPASWGIMFFFNNDDDACQFADSIEEIESIDVLEYIDKASFDLCEEFRTTMSAVSALPSMPEGVQSAIYVEISGQNEDEIELVAGDLIELSMDAGGDPDLAWAMSGDEIEKLRDFRHAIVECVNMKVSQMNSVDSRITKLSIDIVWYNKSRQESLAFYRKLLKKYNIDFIIFGHMGNASPYVDMIPKTGKEYIKGKKIIEKLIKNAVKHGAAVFSELGVGKLNSDLYCHTATVDEMNHRLKLKQKFDPSGIFNPQNMFGEND